MSSTSTTGSGPEPELTAHRQTRYEPPVGATEIVLLRHGASEPFYFGRPFPLTDGHGDPALAPEGEEQAVLTGRRLAGEKIDAVYVTNLRRTSQTAAPFLSRTGLTATVEPDLREIYLGEWEGGLLRQHAVEGHPAWQKVLETGEWGHVPGGESSKQLQSRTVGALKRMHVDHPGQRVLCVVHGGVIGALVAYALGVEPRTLDSSDNCSLHTIVISGDQWVLRRFNDTTHLDHSRFAID